MVELNVNKITLNLVPRLLWIRCQVCGE